MQRQPWPSRLSVCVVKNEKIYIHIFEYKKIEANFDIMDIKTKFKQRNMFNKSSNRQDGFYCFRELGDHPTMPSDNSLHL